jgi:succinoglycan biosynthesis protein ExoM
MAEAPMHSYSFCIVTFRRPVRLARLLRQMAELDWARFGRTAEILVVDNDPVQTARAVVEAHAPRMPVPLRWLWVAEQNIARARNHALQACRTPTCVFLDDDTALESGFLANLRRAWEALDGRCTGALCNLRYEFEIAPPRWLRDSHAALGAHSLFGARRFADGPLTTARGFGANGLVLRRAALAADALAFDERLGATGGEDTELFLRAKRRGHVFWFLKDVGIIEMVPPARMRLSYLASTSFRRASNSFPMLERVLPRPLFALKSLVLAAGWTLVLTAVAPFSRSRLVWALLRTSARLGWLAGALGGRWDRYHTHPTTDV